MHSQKLWEIHGIWVPNLISFKIYVPYDIILKLIMFVNESEIFFILNLLFTIFWMPLDGPHTGRNYRKKTIFTSIWIERTLAQRCRSISKLVRYYFKNMGIFLSLLVINSFNSFWFTTVTKVKQIVFSYVNLNFYLK